MKVKNNIIQYTVMEFLSTFPDASSLLPEYVKCDSRYLVRIDMKTFDMEFGFIDDYWTLRM